VQHVLAPFAPGADRAALRARMEEVAARARSATSAAQFEALAKQFSDDKMELHAERLTTDCCTVTVKPFADAAFALAKPGDVSGVVESSFGYHVLRFDHPLPPSDVSFADARDELRAQLWPTVQKREFARFVDRLTERHRVTVGKLPDEAAP
jgi:hypothetical protein